MGLFRSTSGTPDQYGSPSDATQYSHHRPAPFKDPQGPSHFPIAFMGDTLADISFSTPHSFSVFFLIHEKQIAIIDLNKSRVTADIGKNRLLFKFSGRITKKDLENLYTDVRFCVADLRPGFHVINDLSECKLGSLNSIATFRKIMNYLMENKAGKVIRITRPNSLIHKQIVNFSAGKQGYKPIYTTSLEEAEKLLEESDTQQLALHFHLPRTLVHFSTATLNGTGHIREITLNHCTIDFFSSTLSIDEQILLKLEFVLRDGSNKSFGIGSRITIVEAESFTAEFLDLEEEQQKLLWKCLVQEAQKDI